MEERCYSKGNNQFRHFQGQLVYRNFSLDENGYVRYGFDNSEVAPQKPVSQNSRKWFHLEEDFSTFPLFKQRKQEKLRREFWCLFDLRAVIEFYDTNVLIEINYWDFDEFYTKENFMGKIEKLCASQNLKYEIVGDLGFINITQ